MGTFRVGIQSKLKSELKLSNMYAYGKLISLHYIIISLVHFVSFCFIMPHFSLYCVILIWNPKVYKSRHNNRKNNNTHITILTALEQMIEISWTTRKP